MEYLIANISYQKIPETQKLWDLILGILKSISSFALQWRHNERHGASNHQSHDCLPNRLFGRTSMKTSKLCVTGLCAGNSPVTGEFPAQRASNAESVSIWWRHHDMDSCKLMTPPSPESAQPLYHMPYGGAVLTGIYSFKRDPHLPLLHGDQI